MLNLLEIKHPVHKYKNENIIKQQKHKCFIKNQQKIQKKTEGVLR